MKVKSLFIVQHELYLFLLISSAHFICTIILSTSLVVSNMPHCPSVMMVSATDLCNASFDYLRKEDTSMEQSTKPKRILHFTVWSQLSR